MKTLQEEKFGMQLNKNGNREIWFGKGRRVLVMEPPVLSTMAHLQREAAPPEPTRKGAGRSSGAAAVPTPRRQCVLQGCIKLAEEGACPLSGGSKLACSQPHYALWKKTAKRESGARQGTAQGRAQEGLVTVNQSTLVPGHDTEYVRVSICNALCSVGEVFDFLPCREFHPRLTLQEGEWQPQAGCDNFVRVVNWGDEALSIMEGTELGKWRRRAWTQAPGDVPWEGRMLHTSQPSNRKMSTPDRKEKAQREGDDYAPGVELRTPSPAEHRLRSPVCPPPPTLLRTRPRSENLEWHERKRAAGHEAGVGESKACEDDEFGYAGRRSKRRKQQLEGRAATLITELTNEAPYLPLPVVTMSDNPYQVLAVELSDEARPTRKPAVHARAKAAQLNAIVQPGKEARANKVIQEYYER